MNPELRAAFQSEMLKARKLYQNKNYEDCFFHLERAHILGQRYYGPHVVSHWWMLKTGWKTSNIKEVFGQMTRIIASAGSFLGWVPVGNTGGANVSPIKPMPIPSDLQALLENEPTPSFTKLILTLAGIALFSAFIGFSLI